MATKPARFSYRLSSLMLVVTMVALGLGIARWAPGIGILWTIIASAGSLRTLSAIRRSKEEGDPMTTSDKAVTAIVSYGFVAIIVAASWIAFYATCWVSLLADSGGAETLEVGYYREVGLWGYLKGYLAGDRALKPIDQSFVISVCIGLIPGLITLFALSRWLWPYGDWAHSSGERHLPQASTNSQACNVNDDKGGD